MTIRQIKAKLTAIQRERTEITAQLASATTKLTTGRDFFRAALDLLSTREGFLS